MEMRLEVDDFLSTGNEETLRKVLKKGEHDDLAGSLQRICAAAFSEYIEMILGKQIPTRADEVRERRLYHLLKHHFVGRIPDDTEVAALFQLTEANSRSLIKATLTKFRFNLEEEILLTIRALLGGARKEGDGYRAVVRSETILDEMKRTVSTEAPELRQVAKVRNSAEVYEFPDDTYDVLCRFYGVEIAGKEAAATEE